MHLFEHVYFLYWRSHNTFKSLPLFSVCPKEPCSPRNWVHLIRKTMVSWELRLPKHGSLRQMGHLPQGYIMGKPWLPKGKWIIFIYGIQFVCIHYASFHPYYATFFIQLFMVKYCLIWMESYIMDESWKQMMVGMDERLHNGWRVERKLLFLNFLIGYIFYMQIGWGFQVSAPWRSCNSLFF